MDTSLLIVLIVVALLVAAGVMLMRRRHSERLVQRFGPEYERTVQDLGSRSKAEAELDARKKRVRQFHIVPLSAADAAHFSQAWTQVQARFVDDPHRALDDADRLVGQLMHKRGYPVADFEQSAADISVDHPAVVEHYRAAHAIALRDRQGGTDTETLRQAVVHIRALFADLLEVAPQAQSVQRQAAVQRAAGARPEWSRHATAQERDAPPRDRPTDGRR
jgi:hypothetical protein